MALGSVRSGIGWRVLFVVGGQVAHWLHQGFGVGWVVVCGEEILGWKAEGWLVVGRHHWADGQWGWVVHHWWPVVE